MISIFPRLLSRRRENSAAEIAGVQCAILNEIGLKPGPAFRLLDLGCGNGSTVKAWCNLGVDAYGCDLAFKHGPHVGQLRQAGRITRIQTPPYRLAYPDAYFDALVTNQVMEHVRDYPATLAEMRRVLKPTGCCLHIFPARGRPLEPHVRVPLAARIQSYAWLALWARLGLRKPGQEHLSWRETAKQNYNYLTTSTNYLTAAELDRQFRAYFSEVSYFERGFLANSPNARGRILFRWGSRFPMLFSLYRAFRSRVIVARP